MFQQRSSASSSPLRGIVGIIVAVVAIYLLIRITGFVFSLIWQAAPIIFIASLIIDHKVFTEYANSVFRLFKRNWLYGLGAAALSIFLFPLLALFLLGKALFRRKVRKVQEEMETRQNGELIEYEEIDSEIIDLDLPPAEPQTPPRTARRPDNRYDELFD